MSEFRKVIFVNDFRSAWLKGVADNENITTEHAESIYLHDEYNDDFVRLTERLQGNHGFVYPDGGGEYFEQIDDNWLIPECCFEFCD